MYTFAEQDGGELRVFRLPQDGYVYTIGVDASTGLSEDYSVAQVLSNTIPYEQVAVFRAKWPVNQVSEYIDRLGRFYGEALIVCEVNYPGNSVQDALLQYYKYPRNYQAETHLDEDMDISCKYGFKTTESSKWLLINETKLAFQNKEIKLNDPVTIEEFRTFVYQQTNRKSSAAEGMNDDCVMALMLAYHGAKLYPLVRPPVEKKKKAEVSPEASQVWREFRRKLMRPKERIVL